MAGGKAATCARRHVPGSPGDHAAFQTYNRFQVMDGKAHHRLSGGGPCPAHTGTCWPSVLEKPRVPDEPARAPDPNPAKPEPKRPQKNFFATLFKIPGLRDWPCAKRQHVQTRPQSRDLPLSGLGGRQSPTGHHERGDDVSEDRLHSSQSGGAGLCGFPGTDAISARGIIRGNRD